MIPEVAFGVWVSPRQDWLRRDGQPASFPTMDEARAALAFEGLDDTTDATRFRGGYVAHLPLGAS